MSSNVVDDFFGAPAATPAADPFAASASDSFAGSDDFGFGAPAAAPVAPPPPAADAFAFDAVADEPPPPVPVASFAEPAAAFDLPEAAPAPAAAEGLDFSSDFTAAPLASAEAPPMPEPPYVAPVQHGDSALSQWQKKNEEELTKRAETEANEKRNVTEEAQAELALFTKERNKKIEATKATNRAAQKAAESAAEGANVWAKACSLIDSEAKAKADLSKFKGLLLKLKHSPPVAA